MKRSKKQGYPYLLKVLTGKSSLNGKSKPLFKVSLNTEDCHIDFVNHELAVANVTESFTPTSYKLAAAGFIF